MDIINKYFSDFTEQQQKQLEQLGYLYKDWNEKINVISRKDIDALYEKHVLHSMAIAAVCNFNHGTKVIDIGTGGGFPGIPLAIYFPETQFVLVDSIGKKIKVATTVAEEIGLQNLTAIHSRVENVLQNDFDYAVSRAVAPLSDLWRWVSDKILKGQGSEDLPNGMICLKGGDLSKEIKQSGLKVQAWSISDIYEEPFFEEKYILHTPR